MLTGSSLWLRKPPRNMAERGWRVIPLEVLWSPASKGEMERTGKRHKSTEHRLQKEMVFEEERKSYCKV